MTGRRRLALFGAAVASVALVAGTSAWIASAPAVLASTPGSEPTPATGPEVAVPVTDPVLLRQAKVGLLSFLAANVDRPDRVTAACPALSLEQVTALVTFAGLRPSTRPYLTTVVWDGAVGSGVIAVHCAQDDIASARPPGSSSFVMDVAVIDGRASLQQYAVRVGGPNVIVVPVDELDGASIATACDRAKRVCSGLIEVGGIVVSMRMNNLPPASSAAKLRAVLTAAAPLVIKALAAMPGP